MIQEFPSSTLQTLLEGNIPPEDLARLRALHRGWLSSLVAKKLAFSDDEYALVWLEGCVETEIEEIWQVSPYAGYLGNCLAQAICMEAVKDLLGMTVGRCLPFPEISPELALKLEENGFALTSQGLPGRKYATLTLAEKSRGCLGCAFRADCERQI